MFGDFFTGAAPALSFSLPRAFAFLGARESCPLRWTPAEFDAPIRGAGVDGAVLLTLNLPHGGPSWNITHFFTEHQASSNLYSLFL